MVQTIYLGFCLLVSGLLATLGRECLAQGAADGDSLTMNADLKRVLESPNTAAFGVQYQGFLEKWQAKRFNASQKRTLIRAFANFEEKGLRPRFDFKDVFACFHLAIEKRNFGPELMEKLSIAALALSENFEKPFIQQYFKSLRHFLTSMALKKERSYGIYVENADFEIRYTGFGSSGDEEVILPEQEEAPLDAPDEPVNQPVYDDSPVLYEPFGPVIEFKKADLVFRNRLDTVVLKGMNAYFNFETGELNGIGGTIDWSNVGVPEAFARLREYRFSIDQKVFDFEEVEFQYPGKLPEPVSGKLRVHGNPARNTQDSYPRFVSAGANSTIKGLEDLGIEYRGGISFEGRQFYSKSLYDDKSMILCSRAGKPHFRAYAASFNFNNADSVVSSENAEVTLFCGADSVYHPAVELEFFYGKGYLRLKPAKNGFQTTPFRSSFYKMDVAGDVLNWDMKSDSFNISTLSARTEVPVLLESKNYYNANRFYGLRELYSFHPLLMAVKMAEQAGGNSFYLAEMADMSGINENLLERTMISLMAKGLAIYDSTTKLVTLTEKGFHYVKASRKKSDYDDLIIPSVTGAGPNITFNTLSGEMTVNGVKEFYVSDSLDVIITPLNSVIKVLENRKIEFDGSLKAGNFEFLGREFTFDYDQFLVNLIEVDSIELHIETEPGVREVLSNQLVKTSGVLKINEPDNKSALKSKPEYPIFSSTENATVFFNQTSLLANAYDSTVYFDIPLFELDSVATTAFGFEGTFHSNGIFPEFKENLMIMEDKSLGFLHEIPESGYHLYGTSGKLYGQLRMDQKGMTSPGHIEFLTASLSTESMTFYLDSMYSDKGIEGTIAAGTLQGKSFPSVKFKQYEVNWLAKKDSMKLKNRQEPFSIYDNLGEFDGTLVLSAARGLKGEGEMDIQGSTTHSKAYKLEETAFEARNSSFTVKSSNPKKPILWADDVKLSYDLTAQNARVSAEVQGRASIEFPFARYKTSIPEAEWDMKNNVITMRKPDDIPLEKSFFYTTLKSMDSLAFNATNATYDIEKQEMQIQGIPHIVVADAVITPDSNQMKILENARIQALKNAVVVFDTAAANHRLFNANIEIVSGNRFEGSATYELVTVKDTFAIQFDEFRFAEDEKKGLYTKSSGEVKAEDGVKVSPGFIFKGKVFMHAFRKALELKGAVKLNLKKFKNRNVWIEYFSNDDIEEVILNFDEARTEQGSRLNAGLHFNRGEIYLTFITEKRGGQDHDFFIPSGGNLFYDQKTGTYHIANPGKLKDPLNHYAGNMFSYNEDTREVTFEGKVNFISPFTKGIDLQAAGKGRGNLDSADFRVNAMITMNLGIPLAAMPFMAGDLKNMGEKLGVPRTHDDRSDLIYKVAEFIGDKATKTWDRSYQTVPMPLVNASPELLKDLVITEVNLQWSRQAKAFYSTGKIGLSNVNNIDLNMEMDGFVEIKRTRQGEAVNILLRLTDGTWYYFSRDGFGLITCSSNAAYNQAVRDGKKGKSKAYTNTLAEVMEWASNFRKLYLGIDEPYRLLMAEESSQTIKKKQAVEGDGF